MLDQATAQRIFRYDAASGVLTWAERGQNEFASAWAWTVWNKRFAGKPAGNAGGVGYRKVRVGRSNYSIHRIAWLMVHGEFPSVLDHINGNRSDNRLSNLREVTVAENNRNASRRRDNTSGHSGVSWDNQRKYWVAFIGRRKLGRFHRLTDAIAARKAAELAHDFHMNHGRAA